LVAGFLADAKQAAGGLAVGFANPALYARNGTLALHDVLPDPAGTVTTAVYNEADTDPVVTDLATLGRDSSLTVTPGFDNVTGLGSPTTRFVASFATAPPVKTPPVMTPPKRVPPPVAAAPPAARSGGTTKEPAANTVSYVDVVIDSGGPTPPGHRMSAPVTGGVSCLVIACGIALAALRRRRRPTP